MLIFYLRGEAATNGDVEVAFFENAASLSVYNFLTRENTVMDWSGVVPNH